MNKIDFDSIKTTNCIMPNMKPIYSMNEELFCGEIYYNGRTYLVDLKDKDKISLWTYSKDSQANRIAEGNARRWKRKLYGGLSTAGKTGKNELDAIKKIFSRFTKGFKL